MLNMSKWKLRILNLPYRLGGYIGLDFNGTISTEILGTNERECNEYTPAKPAVKRVLKNLKIDCNDNILDIGCGKGKAMSYMVQFPFERVDGLDINEQLIKVARKNFKILKQNARVHFYKGNAKNFRGYDKYNYIFLYNPFPRHVMEDVKYYLLESLKRNPREMTIIYENPVDRDLFENGDFIWNEYVYDICPQPIVVYRYRMDQNKLRRRS